MPNRSIHRDFPQFNFNPLELEIDKFPICSLHGPGMLSSDIDLEKMDDDGYVEEIKNRLKDLNIKIKFEVRCSQVYREALSGKRWRLIFEAYGDKNIDKIEIENIFQDIIDDFNHLELKVNWYC